MPPGRRKHRTGCPGHFPSQHLTGRHFPNRLPRPGPDLLHGSRGAGPAGGAFVRYHTRRRARQAADKTKTGAAQLQKGTTVTPAENRRCPHGKPGDLFPPSVTVQPKTQRRRGARNGNKPFCPVDRCQRRTTGTGAKTGIVVRLSPPVVSPHNKTKTAVHAVTDRDLSHPIPQNRRYAQRRMAIDANRLQYSPYTDIN